MCILAEASRNAEHHEVRWRSPAGVGPSAHRRADNPVHLRGLQGTLPQPLGRVASSGTGAQRSERDDYLRRGWRPHGDDTDGRDIRVQHRDKRIRSVRSRGDDVAEQAPRAGVLRVQRGQLSRVVLHLRGCLHHNWREEQGGGGLGALREGGRGVPVLQLLSQLRGVRFRGQGCGRDTGEEQIGEGYSVMHFGGVEV